MLEALRRRYSLAALRPPLRRSGAHWFGLKWSIACVEISFDALLAVNVEKLLPVFVMGSLSQGAERSFQQQGRVNAGRLDALHRNRLVETDRWLWHQRDAPRQRARGIH